MKLTEKISNVLKAVSRYEGASSKAVYQLLELEVSYATVKRGLNKLLGENYLTKEGEEKGTKYFLSKVYKVVLPIEMETYFQQDVDERQIIDELYFELIEGVLPSVSLFNQNERASFEKTQSKFLTKIKELSPFEYEKKLERLAIYWRE